VNAWTDIHAARFFIETRTKRFGVPPSELCPPDQVEKHMQGLVDSFRPIANMLDAESGPYLAGETPICPYLSYGARG
jgi:hypothetical protein